MAKHDLTWNCWNCGGNLLDLRLDVHWQ